MFGVSPAELIWLAALIVAAGLVTGLLSGLFGVGGGAVIVPALYEVFRILGVPEDVRMQLCVGTSLAIIVPTTVRAFLAHRAKGTLPVSIVRIWALPSALGVAVGGVIAAFAPGWVFKLAFVVIAGAIGSKLVARSGAWQLGDELPGTPAMVASGFFIGLAASLMGVGGGALSNLFLTSYGTPIHTAVGVSAGLGVVISLAGTIGYVLAGLQYQDLMPSFSLGFVSFLALVLFAPVSVLAAPYGARLAHALPKRTLEVAFDCFLLTVALRFLVSLFI